MAKLRRVHLSHPDGSGTVIVELRFHRSGRLVEMARNVDALGTLTGAQKEWAAAWVAEYSGGELDHEGSYRALFLVCPVEE